MIGTIAVRVLAPSFAVLLPTWLLLRMAGRNRPAARYSLALCGLLSALTSPAIAAGVDHVGAGHPSAPAAVTAPTGTAIADQTPGSAVASPGALAVSVAHPAASRGLEGDFQLLILLVWLGGATVALTGLYRRCRVTASLCSQAQPFPADRL